MAGSWAASNVAGSSPPARRKRDSVARYAATPWTCSGASSMLALASCAARSLPCLPRLIIMSILFSITSQSYAAAFQFAYDFALDIRDAFRRRFAIEDRGVFIHLPLTSRSIWVEWREQSVGFGIERPDSRTTEFFAGRIQGVISVEVQPERASNEEAL